MMKQNLKKAAALIMTVTMLLGMTACAKNSTQETKDMAGTNDDTKATVTQGASEATATAEPTVAESPYADYSGGFEKQVTIQIPVYDRAFEGWNVSDNYYTDWVQAEFGDKYNINVEFVAIGRSTQVTDYMQMLAAGKAPDIIFHYDMPQMLAYYGEGAVQQLDVEELAYYAPNYWSKMGDTINTYSAVDGTSYFFFAERPEAYNNVTVIRKDWLDAVNMEVPTTLEELNAAFTAWKEAGLGKGGVSLVQNSFTCDYPFRDWNMSEEQHALYSDLSVAALTWQPMHDYLKNLNYQYNNELIDTEFYLNTDDASTQADFVAGITGTYNFYISSSTPVIDSLLQNNPDAELAYLPISARSPEGTMPQSRAFWPFGLIMGINHSTSDEERAAVFMYLEWLSNPENLFFMQNGVEGENYTLNESGLAIKNADFVGESKLSNNNNKDYWCLVTESAQYEDEALNYQANLNNWAPKGYESIVEDSYNDFKATAEYRTPDALFSEVITSVADYKADLNEKWKELYVKCVMASEEQFEDTYTAACEEYLNSGYQTILDEKQKAIDSGKYN